MRILQTGITVHDRGRASPGYTLYAPLYGQVARLIDNDGTLVHEWELPDRPAGYTRLLPDGRLLYACFVDDGPPIKAGGKGGLMREVDWAGTVLREHIDPAQHHDVRRRTDGNLVYPAWARMPAAAAARVKGGLADSGFEDGTLWGDVIREVDGEGRAVWEWRFWADADLAAWPLHPLASRRFVPWCNAVFPLENGDVLASFRLLNLVAIIDRGSRRFRWTKQDPTWGMQHDSQLLDNGNLLLFANGMHSPLMHAHSRVIELDPATGEEVWVYRSNPLNHFYSHHISGAQRLPTGNTLICEGAFGRLFEVTPAGDIVWEFINPQFDRTVDGQAVNWVFRAFRYAPGSAELGGRL